MRHLPFGQFDEWVTNLDPMNRGLKPASTTWAKIRLRSYKPRPDE